MTAVERALERSRNDLEAARHLAAGAFLRQAASRSYYAAFHAAEAALLSLGETRSKHAGVLAGFGQFIVRRGGFDAEIARRLRSLYDRRNQADYGGAALSVEEAEGAVGDAEIFVRAVEGWLVERS